MAQTSNWSYPYVAAASQYDASGEMVYRRYTSWIYQGAIDTKETFVEGIYQERTFNCSSTPSVTKYYTAFGRVIASRTDGGTPCYYMADHLGTTTDVAMGSGGLVNYK